MKFLLQLRFSYLDLIWIIPTIQFIQAGKPFVGILWAAVGAVLSVLITRVAEYKPRDKEWQSIAHDKYVEAIKRYRSIYKVTLVEAKGKVDDYISRTKK